MRDDQPGGHALGHVLRGGGLEQERPAQHLLGELGWCLPAAVRLAQERRGGAVQAADDAADDRHR